MGSDVGGLLWAPWQSEDASAGLLLSYDPGRRDDARGRPSRPGSPALRGLGRVPSSTLYGLYGAFTIGGLLEATAVLLRPVRDGGKPGTRGQIGLDLPLPLPKDWAAASSLTGTARLHAANGRYMRRYFGIDPAQSQRSGRPVFRAGGGVYSVGLGLEASHALSAQWRLSATVGVERLQGAAARSPVTERRTQPHADLNLAYEF